MSAGSFGTDPGEPDPSSAGGLPPPPPRYGPSGTYGAPVSPQFQRDYTRRTNSMAIAALCCGVASYVAGPFASIPAIVLAALSLKQIRQTGEDGHGMAVAGLVLGIVATLLFVLAVIVFIGLVDTISQQ